MHVDDAARLTREQVSSVLALVAEATAADGVAPLSEQVLLRVRHDHSPTAASRHLLAYDGPDLVGYAHLDRETEPPTAELVVAVPARRRGVARRLVSSLAADLGSGAAATLQVWAHGQLPAARSLASALGFTVVRELWQLKRALSGPDSEPLPEAELPAGFRHRTFEVGRDEAAWLGVNSRAFAHHPEQGRISLADVEQRQAEPWFDPAGFLLVEDVRTDPPTLAAFHWTKVHDAAETAEAIGEVYVVGVDPAYQGTGLGRAVTVLGLRHLQQRGLREVMLYVDADNAAAVATYTRLGFREWHSDALYVRIAPASVSR